MNEVRMCFSDAWNKSTDTMQIFWMNSSVAHLFEPKQWNEYWLNVMSMPAFRVCPVSVRKKSWSLCLCRLFTVYVYVDNTNADDSFHVKFILWAITLKTDRFVHLIFNRKCLSHPLVGVLSLKVRKVPENVKWLYHTKASATISISNALLFCVNFW